MSGTSKGGPVNLMIGEAMQLIARENPVVLDLRDAHSYRAGHIEGAMLLHDDLMESLVAKKEFDRPLLLYCFRGQSSQEKAKLFLAVGFRRVYSLAGGYVAWSKKAD